MIEERLQGSWVSGIQQNELGPFVVSVTFEGDVLTVDLRFEEGGHQQRTSGLFVVKDGWLISRIMFKGKPVGIELRDPSLILRPPGEKEMMLRRVAARP